MMVEAVENAVALLLAFGAADSLRRPSNTLDRVRDIAVSLIMLDRHRRHAVCENL